MIRNQDIRWHSTLDGKCRDPQKNLVSLEIPNVLFIHSQCQRAISLINQRLKTWFLIMFDAFRLLQSAFVSLRRDTPLRYCKFRLGLPRRSLVRRRVELARAVWQRKPNNRPAKPFSLKENGGAGRDRTDDLLLAKQALSQLSYSPSPAYRKQFTVDS